MVPLYLLVFSLIPRPVYSQPVQPTTGTTSGPLLQPTGSPGRGLDLGHLGSTIGGASGGAIAVIVIGLAFAMLRWSRRQHCVCHNKELGEIVPSLQYRKRNVDVEGASVDSLDDLQFPAPALLPAASGGIDTAAAMRETRLGPPPSYSLSAPNPTQS